MYTQMSYLRVDIYSVDKIHWRGSWTKNLYSPNIEKNVLKPIYGSFSPVKFRI